MPRGFFVYIPVISRGKTTCFTVVEIGVTSHGDAFHEGKTTCFTVREDMSYGVKDTFQPTKMPLCI